MPGRNDPCPCGSGRKYKQCCADRDRATSSAGPLLGEMMRVPLPPGVERMPWSADVVALPARVRDSPLPTLVLVMADDFVLHADVLPTAAGEPEQAASRIAAAVREAASRVGALPRTLSVRHPEVAAPLAAELEGRGVAVRAEPLPRLDDFRMGLLQSMGAGPNLPPVSSPEAWSGWGLPGETVAEIFRAAAAFHRARPWQAMGEEVLLLAGAPDGEQRWTATVMGSAGMEYGIALYQDERDLTDLLEAPFARTEMPPPRGKILSLTFSERAEVSKALRKEVASAGWELAAPEAYPLLIAINTPGAGVSRRDASELAAVLRMVIAMMERALASLPAERSAELVQTDEATGLRLRAVAAPGAGPGLWELPDELAPCGPEGPSAEMGAALAFEEAEVLRRRDEVVLLRFETWLRRQKRLGEATVRKHTDNASLFLDHLSMSEGIPLRAATEYDLRAFLYDWYPRKVRAGRSFLESAPASLRRFFAYLEEREGLRFPWADAILRDRDAYLERLDEFPDGFWWEDAVAEWRAELGADLGARLFLPAGDLGNGEHWGDSTGLREAVLYHELQRRWLIWRDEVVRGGTTEPEQVRAELVRRQHAWQAAPHPAHDGATPLEVVQKERRERGADADDEEG